MNPIVVLSSSAWIVLSSSSGADWCLSSLPLRMSWTRCCGVAIVISISGCCTILFSKSVWGIVPSSFLQLIGRRMYHVAVQLSYCICGIVLVIPFPSLPPLLLLCCLCQARVAMSACGNLQVLVLFVPPHPADPLLCPYPSRSRRISTAFDVLPLPCFDLLLP